MTSQGGRPGIRFACAVAAAAWCVDCAGHALRPADAGPSLLQQCAAQLDARHTRSVNFDDTLEPGPSDSLTRIVRSAKLPGRRRVSIDLPNAVVRAPLDTFLGDQVRWWSYPERPEADRRRAAAIEEAARGADIVHPRQVEAALGLTQADDLWASVAADLIGDGEFEVVQKKNGQLHRSLVRLGRLEDGTERYYFEDCTPFAERRIVTRF